MIKQFCCFFIFIFYCNYSFSQNRTISGFVKDSLSQPIENATIISFPENNNFSSKYTITDTTGYYKLNIESTVNYKIEASHLGYKKVFKNVISSDKKDNYHFFLKSDNQFLEQVVINYKYKAIEKTKDTLTYNVQSFTNGNENKMEDVLTKLPGIRTDGNTIKIHGKLVDKLMVDGKLFFGGSTKLALENLPADVIKKIQVISNYNESKLLKNIVDEKGLVLNVVLKDNSKKFIFGDIEAGLGLNDFYILHPTLFKYTPKSNISFISDVNNFNQSALSFGDLLRLSNGYGNLIKSKGVDNSLYDFSISGNDKFKSLAKFSAINFYHTFNKKLYFEGNAFFSNNNFTNKNESSIEYITDDNTIFEDRATLKNTENKTLAVNLKTVFDDSEKKLFLVYNASYFVNKTEGNGSINTTSNLLSNQFLTTENATNNKFSHYFEGLKKISNHTLALSVRQSISNINALNTWDSSNEFLQFIFPFEESSTNQIRKTNNTQSNIINLLVKDYWIVTDNTHLFIGLGYNYKNSKIKINESQILDDNTIIDFSEDSPDYGNDLTFKLSDINAVFGVKSKIGSMTIKTQITPHYYKFKLEQGIKNTNKKLFIEPKIEIDYDIGNSEETLSFLYNYSNKYLSARSYLKNVTITNFNSVFQGNRNLLDQKTHTFSLDYNNDKREDIYVYASIDYYINRPVQKKVVLQVGINQLNTLLSINRTDSSLLFNLESGKTFKTFHIDFKFSLDFSKINQIVNSNILFINTYDYLFSSTFMKKINKKSHISLNYTKSVNIVVNNNTSTFTEDVLTLKYDLKLLKNITFKPNISTYYISDYEDTKSNYILANASIDYKKPNKKLSYGLQFNNIFNNGIVLNSSFTETVIQSNKIFTLPRILLFKLNYKF